MFVLPMANKQQRAVTPRLDRREKIENTTPVHLVQSLRGLIKYQQQWRLDHRSRNQHETLLAITQGM